MTDQNSKRLFPLLRDLSKKDSKLLNYFQIVNFAEQAEIIIIPLDINYFYENKKEEDLLNLINESKKYAKPIWVYSSGDIGKSLNASVYTFRLGGFNTKLDKNTFIIPAFIQDPYTAFLNKDFGFIKKEEKPTIGFAGHANGTLIKIVKEYLIFLYANYKRIKTHNSYDFQPFFPSGKFRFDLLNSLLKNPCISTDFIYRKKYRAGAKTQLEKKRTTLEFYNNIERNLYTLCVRGAGNFSIRLYEVLAMGRIPVLIKSDFQLPLPWLEWENHCVITDKKNIAERLIKFHNSHSPEDLYKMQESNQKFWNEKLSFEGYFREVHNFFKNEI